MLLYEGGVMFFRYADRRMGLLTAAAGAAVAVLFVFGIFESFLGNQSKYASDEEEMWNLYEDPESVRKGMRIEFFITCASFGCAGEGILLYRLRFYTVFQVYVYTLAFAGAVLIIAAAGTIWLMSGKLKEEEFRQQILKKREVWEERGYLSADKTVRELLQTFTEGKRANLQAWGGGAVLLVCVALEYIRTGVRGGVIAAAVVYVVINLVVQAFSMKGAKQALAVLSQGGTKTILGFFTAYYERAFGKMFSLLPQVQQYAVAALCDQEAYGEALELLRTIYRKPRIEAYFQQYEWICLRGLGDRQGCREALERMEAAMRFLKGKNLENMEEQARLFRSYTEGRYSEVIEALQDGNRNILQKRTRKRLAEAAVKEMQELSFLKSEEKRECTEMMANVAETKIKSTETNPGGWEINREGRHQ